MLLVLWLTELFIKLFVKGKKPKGNRCSWNMEDLWLLTCKKKEFRLADCVRSFVEYFNFGFVRDCTTSTIQSPKRIQMYELLEKVSLKILYVDLRSAKCMLCDCYVGGMGEMN